MASTTSPNALAQPRGFLRRLLRNRAGNTYAMLAAATAPLMAIVGGGIDMGRSYLSETRLQQACDAGVLAARKKLGSRAATVGTVPGDVASTGANFFNMNFKNGAFGTEARTFTMALESDFSISGEATVDVPTTIMAIFGKDKVALTVECESKLNFSNTDIMFVLDTTTSMSDKNSGDPDPRIDMMKQTLRDFHTRLEASKAPGIRMRYGFVPYSTNVNVGGLLQDDWVVDDWAYQTRETLSSSATPSTNSWTTNWTYISGTMVDTEHLRYNGTMHPPANEWGSPYVTCDTGPPPGDNTYSATLISTVNTPYAGPPAGTQTTQHYRTLHNKTYYYLTMSGNQCIIMRRDFNNYSEEYDYITVPYIYTTPNYRYAQISRSVVNWRTETNSCMEERATYPITNWGAIDLTQALDLDIDLVPTSDPKTQWRPMYPNDIWERSMDSSGTSGTFTKPAVTTTDAWFFKPNSHPSLVACPAPSRKLAEITTAAGFDGVLATMTPNGATYHDIGMIWGGRLISPTGLFAADNVDVGGKPTKRHLIYLTDGQTEPFDIAYGAYGVEPLEEPFRRWHPGVGYTLPVAIENRFKFVCEEVKKRNVTIWVIGFGTDLTEPMKACATSESGHAFQANGGAALDDVFDKIASSMGELRISK